MLEQIRVPLEIKGSDDNALTFVGLSAAFSKDLGDDVIWPGAFKRTLDHWSRTKKSIPIPLLDSHNRWAVQDVLGKMIAGKEVEDGLESKFEMVPNDPAAEAAFKRVKGGFITGLSIGYEAVKYDFEQKPGGESWERIRNLREVKLGEVSLVVFPMNIDARIDQASIKMLYDDVKRGRKLSDEQKTMLRALLDESPADTSPVAAPTIPSAPVSKGLAPNDPRRLAMDEMYRDIISRVSRR